MPSNYSKVSTAAMYNASGNIQSDIAELRSLYNRLNGNVMSKLDLYWQGAAKDNFSRQFSMYMDALVQLVAGYERLNAKLSSAGKDYAKTEETMKGMAANLIGR